MISTVTTLPERTRRLFELSADVTEKLAPLFAREAIGRLEAAVGDVRGITEEISVNARPSSASQSVVERIRAARLAKGWTQRYLADRSGMKRANVCRLEGGKHAPTLDTIELMAKALALPLADLFQTSSAAGRLHALNERRARAGAKRLRSTLRDLRSKGII